MLLLVNKAIGSSGAFVTFAAQLFNCASPSLVQHTRVLADAKDGLNNWLQPAYLLGAVLGAFLSSSLSHSFRVPNGVPLSPVNAALGGLLLILGARLANGCTSGHGISGFSLLSTRSIAATCGMFMSGIMLAHILRALGAYPTRI